MATSRKRNVEIDVVVDDAKAKAKLKGIGDSAGQAGSGGFGKLASWVKIGLGALAGSQMLDAISAIDRMNIRAEAVGKRFETVFGETTVMAREWASEQREAFGLSQTGMEDVMAATQDLLVPMGLTRDQAFEMSKEILTTANALSEWTGGTRSAEEAQRIMTKAILGERDGLVELGVKISEADVQTRLAEKGQKGLTGTALEQAKAMATLELITGKSTDALAGYEDRAGSAIAKQKELTSSTAETAEVWAEELKPLLDNAKVVLNDLGTMVASLNDRNVEAAESTGGWKAELGGLFQNLGPVGEALHMVAEGTREQADEAKQAVPKLLDWEKRVIAMGDAAEDAAVELDNLASELLELVDPAFKAARAEDAAREAHEKMSAAVAEFGPKSLEARQATADYAQKALEAKAAQDQLAENGPTLEALGEIAGELGLTSDQAAILDSWLRGLSNVPLFTAKQIENIRKTKEELEAFNAARSGTAPPSSSGGGGAVPVDRRASGGPVSSGETYLVGEKGPELLHMGSSGTVIPNDKIGTSGEGVTVIVQGYVGSEAMLAAELDRLLTNRKKRNGLGF
jgi:hypothetical protein